ncbi:sugar phosphate isomerase/epimerase family protein [Mucilaginibacter aquatilis]|uniref:TIM barrel protein n=1 Tax=Mucilaginibacter aquatilis TaxID=1517760 RepID=A0A6I4ICT6_9SPHI|nr:sugar phosphate isomerase/epimerase [Mucilaginibacter aquatilis]MVN92972.1 TIM barrel protein [Mucilaginibacter aquatilis]
MKNLLNKFVLATCSIFAVSCAFTTVFAQSKTLLFPDAPGIESYTYRTNFSKGVPATLDLIKENSIKDIEFSSLFNLSPEDLRKLLDERGLKCSSFGTGWNNIMHKTAEVANAAKALGAHYIHLGSVPQAGKTFTLQDAEFAVTELNKVGKILKNEYGLELLCHNHGVEFVPYENGTLYDFLIQRTNPKYVSFELDILWAFLPGHDPAQLIDKYPSRIKALHVKDLKNGIGTTNLGKTDHNNNVVLGQGQINIPAVIKAAKRANIKHYYLEDESQFAVEQIPQSIQYLQSLKQ